MHPIVLRNKNHRKLQSLRSDWKYMYWQLPAWIFPMASTLGSKWGTKTILMQVTHARHYSFIVVLSVTQIRHITRTQTQLLLPTVDKNSTIKLPLPLTMCKKKRCTAVYLNFIMPPFSYPHLSITDSRNPEERQCYLQLLDSRATALKQQRMLDSNEKHC